MAKDWRLSEKDVIGLTKVALKSVADFKDDADIKSFTFDKFQDFHKTVFLTKLRQLIQEKQFKDEKGQMFYYDVPLEVAEFEKWSTVGHCVKYVLDQQYIGEMERLILT